MPILSGRSSASLLVLGDATVVPYIVVAPFITSTSTPAIIGSVLTRNNGTWRGAAPITITNQWLRNGTPISGETADTYTVLEADVGATIACSVTASNSAGSTSTTTNSFVPVPLIPANSVILYNGADPGLSGWTRYAAADGLYVQGTVTQSEIATTVANSLTATNLPLSVSTDGAHFPSATRRITSSIYSGSITVQTGISDGGHSHSVSNVTLSSTSVKPYTTATTLLYAATAQAEFPANTICINSASVSGRTQKLAATTYRFLAGGAGGTVDANPVTAAFSGTSGSAGFHDHTGPNSGSSSSPGSGTYNAGSSVGQDHSHSYSGTIAVNRLTAKILKLWNAATAGIANSGDVVMYMGDLSALPSYWKICDGTNGTVDMTGFFLGYASTSGIAHGASTTQDLTVSGTLATNSWTHTHASATNTGIATNTTTIPHLSYSASHNHTLSYSSGGTIVYTPGSIKLAFIQYVPA